MESQPLMNREHYVHREFSDTTDYLIFRFLVCSPIYQQQNWCFEKQHSLTGTQW